MARASQGWPFLVARGRRASYRTVLAPGFLVDAQAHHALADAAGVSDLRADGTRVVEWHHPRVGPFSVGYTSEQLTNADLDATATDGGEPATDEHGRPLEIVYGVVSRDLLGRPLAAEDLRKARTAALSSYRDFLADEAGQDVASSAAFALRGPARARPRRAAAGGAAKSEAGGRSPAATRSRRRRLVAAIAIGILAAAAIAVALLVSSGSAEVTIYASLPLQGSERERSKDVHAGMQLALRQAGGKAGGFAVKFRVLDESSAARGWTTAAVTGNAHKAAQDDGTAVYLGNLESAASALSIPILSRAKIAQISPSNTAVGLTTEGPDTAPDEPEKYYSGGFRNYVRIVPSDTIQAQALTSVMRSDGCTGVAVLHDRNLYGSGLARSLRFSTRASGPRIRFEEAAGPGPVTRQRALARRVADSGADCVVFSGNTRSGAVEIFKALAAELPRARLYGSDGVANRAFTEVDRGGGLPETVATRVKLTFPAVGRAALNAKGKRFLAQFARAYPDNRNPDPYAIYGYEAMALALDAIARSGTGERRDIVKALFATKRRRSVIGTYSIDHNGDTTLTRYGLFGIRDGAPIFERAIQTSHTKG